MPSATARRWISGSRRSAGSSRRPRPAVHGTESATRERVQELARRRAALELELEAIEERLRLAGETARSQGSRLADSLQVEAGLEAAVAAALGGRLGARMVATMAEGAAAVGDKDGAARALVRGQGAGEHANVGLRAPAPGAQRLLDHVGSQPDVQAVVERLLGEAWLVERIADVPEDFRGLAVTRDGRGL